ncbi:MAG: DUF2071 domain-containing protein [Chryseolinea sp.]
MTIDEILNITNHRPWPLPLTNWKYYQEWNNAIFLHWKVNAEVLRKFVPAELEIDMFEGTPWVSLVAFRMDKVRIRYLPSFAPISCFDEVNIRTYARYKNKAGVYFLSIEGGTALSCRLAKAMSELPYRYSRMSHTDSYYSSYNAPYGDKLEIDFKIGQPMSNKSDLDRWLTARYALFQDAGAFINEFEIHHVEWPTYEIDLQKLTVSYNRFGALLSRAPDASHYSTGVQVLGWGKRKNRR